MLLGKARMAIAKKPVVMACGSGGTGGASSALDGKVDNPSKPIVATWSFQPHGIPNGTKASFFQKARPASRQNNRGDPGDVHGNSRGNYLSGVFTAAGCPSARFLH